VVRSSSRATRSGANSHPTPPIMKCGSKRVYGEAGLFADPAGLGGRADGVDGLFVIRKTFGRPGNQNSSGSRPTAPNRPSTMDDPGRAPRDPEHYCPISWGNPPRSCSINHQEFDTGQPPPGRRRGACSLALANRPPIPSTSALPSPHQGHPPTKRRWRHQGGIGVDLCTHSFARFVCLHGQPRSVSPDSPTIR
jgi:hypothetical protein